MRILPTGIIYKMIIMNFFKQPIFYPFFILNFHFFNFSSLCKETISVLIEMKLIINKT